MVIFFWKQHYTWIYSFCWQRTIVKWLILYVYVAWYPQRGGSYLQEQVRLQIDQPIFFYFICLYILLFLKSRCEVKWLAIVSTFRFSSKEKGDLHMKKGTYSQHAVHKLNLIVRYFISSSPGVNIFSSLNLNVEVAKRSSGALAFYEFLVHSILWPSDSTPKTPSDFLSAQSVNISLSITFCSFLFLK
jgi:hypothetical protein